MAKRLFLLLIISFIEVVLVADFLTADENFLIKSPEFKDVQTVKVQPEVINEISATPDVAQNNNFKTIASSPTVVQPEVVYLPPVNNIVIAGRTLRVVDVPDTAYDSGNHVNRYGDRFLYGHNSSNVFGGLVNLGVGGVFSVTLNGSITNYRVERVVIFEKNISTGQLQINGNGNYMWRVANAMFEGVSYGLSIMTCYGTSYGNGDASHRLVLFANAI